MAVTSPDCLLRDGTFGCPLKSSIATATVPNNLVTDGSFHGNMTLECLPGNSTSECIFIGAVSDELADDIISRLNEVEVRRQIPLIVFLVLIVIVGIPGNFLVCYIYRSRYTLSSSRWFIFFLASVDTFSCVIVVPCEIATTFLQYNFSNVITCKMTAFMNMWMLLCLGFTLVLIAIDRYRKVCHPFGWQINIGKAKVLCCFAILLSLAISIPVTVMYRIHSFPLGKFGVTAQECSIEGSQKWVVYYVMFGMSMFVSALTTICVLYCLIGCQIKHHVYKVNTTKRAVSLNSSTKYSTTRINHAELQSSDITTDVSQELAPLEVDLSTNASAKETFDDEKPQMTPFKSVYDKRHSTRLRQARARRATFIMFLISIVFVISYLPLLALMLYRSFQPDAFASLSGAGRTSYKFFLRSFFVSCAVNPLIYGISDPKFRRNCKDVLRKIVRCFSCSSE